MNIPGFSSIDLDYSSIQKNFKQVEQKVSKLKNCKLKNDGFSWAPTNLNGFYPNELFWELLSVELGQSNNFPFDCHVVLFQIQTCTGGL